MVGQWVCHGKVFYKSTGEVERKRALKVLEKLTRPFREDDDAAVISNLELMLKRLKTNAADTRKKLAVKDIWTEFEKTLWQSDLADGSPPSRRPPSCRACRQRTSRSCR